MLSSVLIAMVMARSALLSGPPPAPREFRGVWVATVDHIDWPPREVTDTEKQKSRLLAILDQAQKLHLNAVLFQVRPVADALYASPYEPWSEFLTGAQGRPPKPYWDPLEFVVWEAHLRGLELHAWFNPYRAWHPAEKGAPASNYIGYTHPNWVKTYGRFKWMDPGASGVSEWSQNVILDVVKRYDIDGVHLDDYFYPYAERDSAKRVIPFPDSASYAAYQSSGGSLSRDDWRRKNVNDFVSNLYKRIHATKNWVKLGISPFGIFRPGVPAGIKAGVDQYAELYADCQKWLTEGWVDYMVPQLYWPIHQTPQSYPVLLKWWVSQNTANRNIYAGNFTSGLDAKWPLQEIVDEIHLTRATPGAKGNVHFSMAPFMKDAKGVNNKLETGLYSMPAMTPASPWLKRTAPRAPKVQVKKVQDGKLVTLQKESMDAWQWGIYIHRNGNWVYDHVMTAQQSALLLNPKILGAYIDAIAVSAVDRYGNESERVVVPLAG